MHSIKNTPSKELKVRKQNSVRPENHICDFAFAVSDFLVCQMVRTESVQETNTKGLRLPDIDAYLSPAGHFPT